MTGLIESKRSKSVCREEQRIQHEQFMQRHVSLFKFLDNFIHASTVIWSHFKIVSSLSCLPTSTEPLLLLKSSSCFLVCYCCDTVNLTRSACMSMGKALFTGAWTTLQWLYHGRQWLSFSHNHQLPVVPQEERGHMNHIIHAPVFGENSFILLKGHNWFFFLFPTHTWGIDCLLDQWS